MVSRDVPTADVPILLFLIGAIGVVSALAGTVLWLQRPTVIESAVQAEYEAPRAPALFLPTSSALAMTIEENATLAADKANEELGLKRTTVARSDPPEPAAAPAAAKPKRKPRQVAPRQAPAVADRRPWRNDEPWRNERRAFGWSGFSGSFFN
jgi:hypothetical protein